VFNANDSRTSAISWGEQTNLDQELNKELLDIAKKIDCKAELGKTMCTYDFYEGNYTQLRQ
jgi:purine-nucleoside phosphorylase